MEELKGVKSLKERVSEIEKMTTDIFEKQEKIAEEQKRRVEHRDKHITHMEETKPRFIDGFSISGGITMVGQGTSGNDDNDPPAEDVIDSSISADLEISVASGEHGEAFMLMEAGAGEGLQDDEIASFWGVNDDAGESESKLEVTEAWYEHRFLGDNLTFTIGKVDLSSYFDGNEAANDETIQFLATGFVNSIAVEFPDNGPGARLTVSPDELLDISLGVQSGDSDWEDIIEDPFLIAEIDVRPKFGDLQGNYRLYGWLNKTAHAELKDASNDDEEGWGAGISLDQQATESLTLFTRVGYQDKEVYEFDIAWSVGLALNGSLWSRDDDVIGIAYGMAVLSDEYEDVLRADGINPGNEGHLEAYYSIAVNEHLSISPDIQVITNALGDDDFDTTWIGGIRGQFTF